MMKIFVDNKEHEVEEGKNLLEVCLSLGYNLPYFCWHPALGSVGACRQCAVKKYKDEDDKEGKLSMACMEPVVDNLRVSIEDPEAVHFRKTVVEWLMTNHPHDCAVCDEGGECHLQDMTVMTGHNYRRFNFNKRTYENQYLGPFINHEMNRCIQCYRCVRFYQDYAGGKDLDVFASSNHVYFGRAKDGVLENEFSGNLVEICPTGVFTDKTLKKHYTRKWDLTTAPSICEHCSVGCNTIVGERYGSVRRVLSRYNSEVNGYFLCDKGRFGYEYNSDPLRINHPSIKTSEGAYNAINCDEAVNKAAEFISSGKRVIGVGSPRASLEANYALKRLVKDGNYYAGIDRKQHGMVKRIQYILNNHAVTTPSLNEISECDAVVILGEDLTNTAPMMALNVRQAVRQKPKEKAKEVNIPAWQDAAVREVIQEENGPLYIATPFATKLEDISTKNHYANPKQIAALAFSIAHQLDEDAPNVDTTDDDLHNMATEIAGVLKQAKNPLIISGTSCLEPLLIEAASNLAQACYKHNSDTKLSFVVPECNSMGQVMMEDKFLEDIVDTKDEIDTLILLENDLFLRKDEKSVEAFLSKARQVIVLDHLENATTEKADLLLSSCTTAESQGTYINQEGRAQRFYQVFKPEEEKMESWRWLSQIQEAVNNDSNVTASYETLLTDMVSSYPQFEEIHHIAPPPGFRIAGQKIARESHRYSGRTANHANENISEPKPKEDPDSPFSFTMEGYHGTPPAPLIPSFWSPGWNSAQAINKYQIEIGGPLHGGDPGIRLIKPKSGNPAQYYNDGINGKISQPRKMTVIPRHHIFGSGELSKRSPGIAELSPEPYIGISIEDAKKLNLNEGESIKIQVNGSSVMEKITIAHSLPAGLLAIPVELEEFSSILDEEEMVITKAEP